MASAQPNSVDNEQAPLLAAPEHVVQRQGEPTWRNLFSGSAAVAQAGILIMTALVWSGIFSHPLIFFSPHPVLNSAAILLQVQGTLVLQPTATPHQKFVGTRYHYAFQGFSVVAFIAAFVIIEINKGDHARFTSPHGRLGLITYIVIVLQSLVGVVQYFFPRLVLGSVDNGKRIYKYHRWSGYVLILLELATVVAATQTSYNLSTLGIPLWATLVSAVLVIAGLATRIKKHKLGL